MTSTKAQAAKDKGNAAFKAGDYPSAIGHYTQAILEDQKDFTFPLNRAAAYLKLGKYEDAERDCTTVLSLNAANVKALFRRGQARIGIGKFVDAAKDLEEAAKIEPNNQAVQRELDTIKEKRREKNGKIPVSVDVVHPNRRRVPIKIIDPPSASSNTSPAQVDSTSTERDIKVAKSSPLSSSPAPSTSSRQNEKIIPTTHLPPPTSTPSPAQSPTSTTPSRPSPSSPPPPKSFQDAKRAREDVKTSRVGGGIFRASGRNTIFPTRETSVPASASDSFSESLTPEPDTSKSMHDWAPDVNVGTRKMSLFDFNRVWENMGKDSFEDKFQLIASIAPSNYPSMFQSSLEPSLLVAILEVFQTIMKRYPQNENIRSIIAQSMAALPKVPRIGMVVLFLTQREKSLITEVLSELGNERLALWKDILKI